MSAQGSSCDHNDGRKGEIVRMGYLKKLKTMKKKFFILRGESSEASARLEYYDNEKKWRSSQPPKRAISLKTCFNINRRKDTKKFVIALYTKEECFCIVLESEEDLQSWLKVLLKLQAGEDTVDGEPPKPTFEHVWKVTLQEKGLGDSKKLVGPYHLCLTDTTLSLVKITDEEGKPECLEFPLIFIRRSGFTGSFFYIEVGRQTVTGAGELWMLAEDAMIARNMDTVVRSAFITKQKDQKDVDSSGQVRPRSSSDSSKVSSYQRRLNQGGVTKPLVPGSYSGVGGVLTEDVSGVQNHPHGPSFGSFRLLATGQENDAAPLSEPNTHAVPVASSLALSAHCRSSALHLVPRPPSQRRHSVSAMSSSSVLGTSTMVQHQRTNSIPLSSNSESSDTFDGPSTIISHQRTKSCPVSESSVPIPAAEQAASFEGRKSSNPPCPIHRDRVNSQSSIDFARTQHAGDGSDHRRSSVSGRRSAATVKSTTTFTGRDRSDSMPSRPRTTSEGGHHAAPILSHTNRVPYIGSRPPSVHSRGISYSPPAASGPSSTISSGSSPSIDDGEVELPETAISPRYGHPSTPDGPAIIEEIVDGCAPWSHETVEEEESEKVDDYVQMGRPAPSLSLPIHSSGVARKISPLQPYMDVCSPCGSSPLESNYLPMSPGESARRVAGPGSSYSASHSRGSSFAEETPDGYVPMAPNATDDGYVDMEPLPGHNLHGDDGHHSDMSPGSSCSFTSGTPSTDMRFSEYHLDKVAAFLTHSEEDEISSTDRPSRTYSFGSQPDTIKSKGKLEVSNTAEAGRVRAFSVGSKWGRPRNLTKEHKLPSRSHILPHGTKSSSAPLLSSSWSGTPRHAHSSQDKNAHLMEIDFTDNKKKKKNSNRFRGGWLMEAASQNLDLKSLHTAITSSADSGYMDMSSKSPSGFFSSTKMQSAGDDITSASPPSVMAGSPRTQGLNAAFGKSPPKPLSFGRSPPKYSTSFGRSPPKSSPLIGSEGMLSKTLLSPFSPPEMSSRLEPKNTRLNKPAIISSSTLKTIGEKPDVKLQKFPTTSSANLNICALPNKPYAPGNSPRPSGNHSDSRSASLETCHTKDEQNYMEMKGGTSKKLNRTSSDRDVHFSKDTPAKGSLEGYMEMSWGGTAAKLTRKSSGGNFNAGNTHDDYMPMFGSSQPIAIQGSSSSGGVVGRTTPPKVPPNFLSLENSSPRRNVRRKNRRKHERRGSKENVTTPTGSNSAIFPLSLSSPLSPKKSATNSSETNESTTLTNSPRESTETSPVEDSPYSELNLNDEDSPYAEMTPGVKLEEKGYSEILGSDCKSGLSKENETDSNLSIPLSRVLRISSKDNSPTSNDYVNYSPLAVSDETSKKECGSSDEFGDYALMRPIDISKERKVSAYCNSVTKKSTCVTETPLNTSTSVPFCATANNSDPKSVIAQKSSFPPAGDGSRITRQASSPLPQKSFTKNRPLTPKSNENQLSDEKTEETLLRLSSSNVDNSKSSNLKTNDAHSSISRQISTSSTSSSEFGERKSSLKLNESYSGVTRQVSTSSSSSTEVMSMKEAQSPVPSTSAASCGCTSRPSSVSSERDITYASLDLAPSGSEGEDSARSPRGLRNQTSQTESCASSPSPNPSVPGETFTYVEIDFEKSASLRAPQAFNKKIRH